MPEKPNLKTPESFLIGEQFEKYTREIVFTKEHFIMVDKTHTYLENFGDFIESSTNPDFKFRDKLNGKEFYLEAKFRSFSTFDNKVNLCRLDQLKRYQKFDSEFPVFVLLGLRGTPDKPELLSLIPLHEIKYTELFLSKVFKFKIDFCLPITSKSLWKLI